MNEVLVKTKDKYDLFVEEHLAELERYQSSPELMAIINQTLPNDSEKTDFAVWRECLTESVADHKDVIDEWAKKV